MHFWSLLQAFNSTECRGMRREQTKWSVLPSGCGPADPDNKKQTARKNGEERNGQRRYRLRLADSERAAEDRTKQKVMRKVLKSKSAFRPGLLDLFLALSRCCNGGVWWRDRSAELMPAVGGQIGSIN
jgi:hypothetical protein